MIDEQKIKQLLVDNNLLTDSTILIKPLGTGERNQNYVINNKLVLRIGLMNQSEKYLKREFDWLKRVKAHAPTPLYLDTSSKILEKPFSILSYTKGTIKGNWTNEQIAVHAKNLANLHSNKSNFWGFGQKNKMLDIEKSFLRDVRNINCETDQEDKEIIKKTAAILHQHLTLFSEIKQFSLIHGDCCNSNILHHNEEINYIDWEWSAYRDNAEDLARLYYPNSYCPPWTIQTSKEQIDFFIEQYQKYHPDPTLKKRVELWNLLQRTTDYLYFKRVLQQQQFNDIPKEAYEHTVKELKASIQ
ncbi:MAG: aminoglycoside phosphotransferase family protein [Nanoarchaeota archaeon]|nr:aminoglycoside phosphotransferase family protein [Nanoarchaeota archaeon]